MSLGSLGSLGIPAGSLGSLRALGALGSLGPRTEKLNCLEIDTTKALEADCWAKLIVTV